MSRGTWAFERCQLKGLVAPTVVSNAEWLLAAMNPASRESFLELLSETVEQTEFLGVLTVERYIRLVKNCPALVLLAP